MLTSLKVRHFRCFAAFEAEFQSGSNFIVGPNARGKTSLLEAACILLRLQSPRVVRLAAAIQHDQRGFVADGYYAERHLQFYFSVARKKLALDGVPQKTAREYLQIGRLVYFANSDIELARGASEVRRRFLDALATQRLPGYREALRNYERALRSRNLLLKSPAPRWREILAFDEPLINAGLRLIEARRDLVSALMAPVNAAHAAISNTREELRIEYLPSTADDLQAALKAARAEDGRLRQTTVGPHRDDLRFVLEERSGEFASEGQQRTLVLALKLGAAKLLADHFETPPLLLLDDIFGELDPERRNALLGALPAESQRLITTTHLNWMSDVDRARVLRL